MDWNPNFLWFIVPLGGLLILILIFSLFPRRKKPVESPFTNALSRLINGDKPGALNKLREAVKEDTDNIEAYLLYGEILRGMGQFRKAIQVHRELTIRKGIRAKYRSDIQRALLLDYHLGGYHREALKYAEELLKADRRDVWTLKKKLDILEELEDWPAAGITAKRLQAVTGAENKPQLALYKCMEGAKTIQEGREHEARLRFREAIKLDKSCAMAYFELAGSYLRAQRFVDAINIWKQFFNELPELSYLAFDQLEKTVFDLNRFQELEQIYRDLVNRSPGNTRAVVALARFLDRKGETEAALRICRDGLEHSPQSLWIRRNLFRFLTSMRRLDEACETGLELVNIVTDDKEEFVCKSCGYITGKPLWRCPKCKKWNTFRV